MITKLVIVCLRKNLRLIIENPYSSTHYLVKYWSIKSNIVHYDRRKYGDYFVKPTQYWFINCTPENNVLYDMPIVLQSQKKCVETCRNAVERSMISKDYALRFIREYIL